MSRRPVPSRKTLPGNNKCGSIRSKIRKEISETNERHESAGRDRIEPEPKDAEDDSQN